MTTWMDKQKAAPHPAKEALRAWHQSTTHDELLKMEDAVEAYLSAEKIANECDEPGCKRVAMSGFPVIGGYRRTCSDHTVFQQR